MKKSLLGIIFSLYVTGLFSQSAQIEKHKGSKNYYEIKEYSIVCRDYDKTKAEDGEKQLEGEIKFTSDKVVDGKHPDSYNFDWVIFEIQKDGSYTTKLIHDATCDFEHIRTGAWLYKHKYPGKAPGKFLGWTKK
uniref:hypothetical protein n=1 Tax=Leptospira interrogans TaxID=173 RepID=UPI0039C8CEDD